MTPAAVPAQVLLAGNPNSGKSTLFNALSGGNAHVGNYPGITVDRESARVECGARAVELVDVPGIYSLTADSPEEQLAIRALFEEQTEAVMCVVDATTLQRGLYLALQLIESSVPVVVAVNMMDAAEQKGIRIDIDRLAKELGVPVVPVVATKKKGVDGLLTALEGALRSRVGSKAESLPRYTEAVEADIAALQPELQRWRPDASAAAHRSLALWSLLSLGDDELEGVPESLRKEVDRLRNDALENGRNLELEIVGTRYAWLERVVSQSTRELGQKIPLGERLDNVLMHPVAGLLIFAIVMFGIFEALFAGAEPMIAAIEDLTALLQSNLRGLLPEGAFRALLIEGVISGVGNVLVFVPQILMLFLFIGFLEDSGYLARVAFVIDRVMKRVGLHGKAFVPLLSGFACAVPAVMATRTIERRKDRLVTMMALPLMACSARLPVFILIVGTVFAGETVGWFSAGAVALFLMYTLSVLFTLAAAFVLRRTVLRGPAPTFVLEMPAYRWPAGRVLWVNAWRRLRIFLIDAGTIILAMTIILWALLSYPKSPEVTERYASEREQIALTVSSPELRAEALETIDTHEASEQLRNSVGGRLGRWLEPVLRPLGFDWRIGVGIIGAFAAREVFVSTMGVVFGIGDADEDNRPLRDALREARHADGALVMTPLTGVSLMLFFLLACQCMSTIAVVRRESGSWRWPVLMFSYMTVLAYVVSLAVYQGGRALGFG